MKRLIVTLMALMLSAVFSVAAFAHESRPILVEISEISEIEKGQNTANYFELFWKIPLSVEKHMIPTVVMPEDCQVQVSELMGESQYVGKKRYQCTSALSGKEITLDYPVVNPSVTTLFRLNLNNGERHSHLLKPGVDTWKVPAAEDTFSVAKDYTSLGIQHIWEGIDHLLFVACLVFIAGRFKRIVITITGFTIAHSITLAMSTLGLIYVPVPPVEAVIALSIVFLAHEIACKDETSWTFRYPVVVSSSFGLLHGFGFAAVLSDLGLPQTELGTALLFFNVGVEIGQLLFILALVTIFMLLAKMVEQQANSQSFIKNTFNHLQTPASYLIGTVASFWMIERIMGFWS